jgi:hypothetical protein
MTFLHFLLFCRLGYMTTFRHRWCYIKQVQGGYAQREDMPRACKYGPTKGQMDDLAMRFLVDRVLSHDITRRPYEDHRQVTPFDDISLYFGWIRNLPNKVKYLPERALRQFWVRAKYSTWSRERCKHLDYRWADCESMLFYWNMHECLVCLVHSYFMEKNVV